MSDLIKNLNISLIPEFKEFEETQKKLVEENPFVEITDSKSYEVAKKSRTALLKGRTSLTNQEKVLKQHISAFSKEVSSKTLELIEITKPHEEKQQEEVTRYEEAKQREKDELERIEKERIFKIENHLDNLETNAYELIQKMVYESISDVEQSILNSFETDFDFEEFVSIKSQVKSRVLIQFESKKDNLVRLENERLQNEKIRQENERLEQQTKIQNERLQKVTSLLVYGTPTNFDLSKIGQLYEYSETEFNELINSFNDLKAEKEREKLEADQKQKQIELDRQEAEKVEKDKIFESKKTRLFNLGFEQFENHFAIIDFGLQLDSTQVYNADFLDFENIISEMEKAIKFAKKEIENNAIREKNTIRLFDRGFTVDMQVLEYELVHEKYSDIRVTEKEVLSDNFDKVLEVFETKIKEAENKDLELQKQKESRELEFKNLKSVFEKQIKKLSLNTDIENVEFRTFAEKANEKLEALKNQLLTELNNF